MEGEILKHRRTFRSMMQEEYESSLEFLERLTRQARRCNFEDMENEIFHQVILHSNFKMLGSLALKRKWKLSELKLALITKERDQPAKEVDCYRCGSKYHGPADEHCYGYFSVCRGCNQRGHLTHMCWNKSTPRDYLSYDSPLTNFAYDDILDSFEYPKLPEYSTSTMPSTSRDFSWSPTRSYRYSPYTPRGDAKNLSPSRSSEEEKECKERVEKIVKEYVDRRLGGRYNDSTRSQSSSAARTQRIDTLDKTRAALKRAHENLLKARARAKSCPAKIAKEKNPKTLSPSADESSVQVLSVNTADGKTTEIKINQPAKKKVTFADDKKPLPKPLPAPSLRTESNTILTARFGDVMGTVFVSDEFAVNVMSTQYFEAHKMKCTIYSNKEVIINSNKFIGEMETNVQGQHRGLVSQKIFPTIFYFSDAIGYEKCIVTSYTAKKLMGDVENASK